MYVERLRNTLECGLRKRQDLRQLLSSGFNKAFPFSVPSINSFLAFCVFAVLCVAEVRAASDIINGNASRDAELT
jgi:hypothetical protein